MDFASRSPRRSGRRAIRPTRRIAPPTTRSIAATTAARPSMFSDIRQKYPKSDYLNDSMYYEAYARYKIGTTDELHTAAKLLEPLATKIMNASNTSNTSSTSGTTLVTVSSGDYRYAIQRPRRARRRGRGALQPHQRRARAARRSRRRRQGRPRPRRSGICDNEDIQVQRRSAECAQPDGSRHRDAAPSQGARPQGRLLERAAAARRVHARPPRRQRVGATADRHGQDGHQRTACGRKRSTRCPAFRATSASTRSRTCCAPSRTSAFSARSSARWRRATTRRPASGMRALIERKDAPIESAHRGDQQLQQRPRDDRRRGVPPQSTTERRTTTA